MGYAQTYLWTTDIEFLETAMALAEYYIRRVETSLPFTKPEVGGRYVPLWDFDAPILDESNPLRDSSAGVIAANGMLILSQALAGLGRANEATRFREMAITIVKDTLDFSLSLQKMQTFVQGEDVLTKEVDPGS